MRRAGGDSRGASEVLGAGLLAGIVLAAAVLTVTTGGALLGDAQSTNDRRQAQLVLQDVDADVESLTRAADATTTKLDFSDTNPGEFHLVREGRLNVSIDDGACATSVNLTSLRYEEEGSVVAYEGGGVWRSNGENASSMISRPSVTTSDGRIQVSLVNLSGIPDRANNPVRYHPERSKTTTATHQAKLSALSCRPPDNLTLSVTSDFAHAWGQYLQSEFGVDAAVYDTNDTARITLEQSDLPDRLNISSNHVVNLSNPGYMDSVSISAGTPGEVTFDKGEGNTYEASIELLHDGTPPWGRTGRIVSRNLTRPRADVVFVIEDSQAMREPTNPLIPSSITHLSKIENASRGLVGELNGSRDRAGVVSYNDTAEYNLTNGEAYLSSNFSSTGVNETINNTGVADTGVRMDRAVRTANNVFDLQSNASRQKIMVLFSGQNHTGCPTNGNPRTCDLNNRTLDYVADAAKNGVTIYTVNVDSNSSESLLRSIAFRTGGRYFSSIPAPGYMKDTLDEIARDIAEQRYLFRQGVTANVTVGGTVLRPDVAGNDGHVIEVPGPGGHEFENMNDPTAPGEYAFGFEVDGGEAMRTKGHTACDLTSPVGYDWTEFTVQHNGEAHTVYRCVDETLSGTVPVQQVLTDGDQLPPAIHTNYNYSSDWREEINDTFARRGDVALNEMTGELDLQSNQALLYYRPSPGSQPDRWMLLLYEVGVAESDASYEIVDVRVSHVAFE